MVIFVEHYCNIPRWSIAFRNVTNSWKSRVPFGMISRHWYLKDYLKDYRILWMILRMILQMILWIIIDYRFFGGGCFTAGCLSLEVFRNRGLKHQQRERRIQVGACEAVIFHRSKVLKLRATPKSWGFRKSRISVGGFWRIHHFKYFKMVVAAMVSVCHVASGQHVWFRGVRFIDALSVSCHQRSCNLKWRRGYN